MKKLLARGIIGALVILPTFVAAQTTPTTNNSALIAVLEQLVQILTQELNQLLAQQGTATTASATATSTTTNQTFTTPGGAVIDGNGNVISTPPQAIYTAPTTPVATANTSQASTNTTALTVALGKVNTTQTTAHVAWSTNIPANSKLFLTQMPIATYSSATQVIASPAGYSTQGFVNISNLTPGTQYAYTIEATVGTQDQKITGSINTSAGCQSNPKLTTTLGFPSGGTFSISSPTSTIPERDYENEGAFWFVTATYTTGCSLEGASYSYRIDAYFDGQGPNNMSVLGSGSGSSLPPNGSYAANELYFDHPSDGTPDNYVINSQGGLPHTPGTYDVLFTVNGISSEQQITITP